MRLQELIDRLSTHGSLKVRSAANPVLWMVGTIGTIVAASMFARPPEWVYAVLLAIFGLTVLTTLGIFIFMVARRPDDLRSEEYLLESRRISMYRDAGQPEVHVPSKELPALPDPKSDSADDRDSKDAPDD